MICDYILAIESEIKLSDNYRLSILSTLITLSRTSDKNFKAFVREDVIRYLNRFRKNDSDDPKHKWINSYNQRLINVIRFFKWLYHPYTEPIKRLKPKVVQNLHILKRREISGYEPGDMWDDKDHLLFLKYCPNPRDRCYHAIESEIGARPHEVLKLKIKDIEFIDDSGTRYARVVLNGKTGERVVPLIDSIPYVTQWISLHPQGSNREAILLPKMNTGKAIKVNAMSKAYSNYKKYFTSLLSENIPEDDKKSIKKLLNKRWNPYVLRHSALTEKSKLLSTDSTLKQFAGWTPRSTMHHKYVHLRGGESMEQLLKVKGIIKEVESENIMKPKICFFCHESNTPDAQFCYKCNSIISFEAYRKNVEEKERKDQELHELKEQVEEIRDLYHGLIKTLNEAVVLRGKIQANPQEFLEADPFKFAAIQKRRYNSE